MQDKHISLAHGNGGRYMRELIAEIFARHLSDPDRADSLDVTLDAAPINPEDGDVADSGLARWREAVLGPSSVSTPPHIVTSGKESARGAE